VRHASLCSYGQDSIDEVGRICEAAFSLRQRSPSIARMGLWKVQSYRSIVGSAEAVPLRACD